MATSDQVRPTRVQPPPSGGDTLTTAQMRARYDALRAATIEQAVFQSNQRLVKHGLLLAVSVILLSRTGSGLSANARQ